MPEAGTESSRRAVLDVLDAAYVPPPRVEEVAACLRASERRASAAVQGRSFFSIRSTDVLLRCTSAPRGFWSSLASGDISGAAGAAWDAATDWDDIKRVATIGAFGACIVVSAGACVAVGVAVAGAKFVGDGLIHGEWNGNQLATDLAWAAGGGAVGAAFARTVGGASNMRNAVWGNALDVTPIMSAAKTRVPGVRGPGGGQKTCVTTQVSSAGPVHGGVTGVNMGFNGMLGSMVCGTQGGCW